MDVLILSGGFGTRLYPLTENIPKALVEVNNKPVLNYIIEKIENLEGIEKIHIVSNNKFYINLLEWKEKLKIKKTEIAEKIKIFNNGVNKAEEIKGVPREIKDFLNIAKINHDLLLLACDNLFDFDLNKLVSFKKEKNSSSVVIKKIENPELVKKYSSVLLDESGRIIDFEEKPETPKSNLVSVFCYLLKKDDLILLEKNSDFSCRNTIEFLCTKSNIYGKVFEDFWIDIGSLSELKLAEEHFNQKEISKLAVAG